MAAGPGAGGKDERLLAALSGASCSGWATYAALPGADQ